MLDVGKSVSFRPHFFNQTSAGIFLDLALYGFDFITLPLPEFIRKFLTQFNGFLQRCLSFSALHGPISK